MSKSEGDSKFILEDAPSIGTDPNENPEAFFNPGTPLYQTIAAVGTVTKDMIFATIKSDEEISPEAIASYSKQLQVKSRDDPQSSIQAKKARSEALALINGTKFNESELAGLSSSSRKEAVDKALAAQEEALLFASKITDSGLTERMSIVNKGFQDKVASLDAKARSLSIAAGINPDSIAPPQAITAATSKFNSKFSRTAGITAPRVLSGDSIIPTGGSGVYSYEVIDLYDDRYDFETGKKIRYGVAAGVGGGAGDTTTKGNTEDTIEQSESDDTGPAKC